MAAKSLLKTYIKQGTEYKKLLEKVNSHGKHSAKIAKIEEKIRRAKKAIKAL